MIRDSGLLFSATLHVVALMTQQSCYLIFMSKRWTLWRWRHAARRAVFSIRVGGGRHQLISTRHSFHKMSAVEAKRKQAHRGTKMDRSHISEIEPLSAWIINGIPRRERRAPFSVGPATARREGMRHKPGSSDWKLEMGRRASPL